MTRSGRHPWLVLLLLLQAPVGQVCASAAERKGCNGVQVQGKNRELVAETAHKLGLDGTYIPRSYIEQVLAGARSDAGNGNTVCTIMTSTSHASWSQIHPYLHHVHFKLAAHSEVLDKSAAQNPTHMLAFRHQAFPCRPSHARCWLGPHSMLTGLQTPCRCSWSS